MLSISQRGGFLKSPSKKPVRLKAKLRKSRVKAAYRRLNRSKSPKKWPSTGYAKGAIHRKRTLESVSGVCFDLDGVLINTMPLHAQAWLDALRPYRLQLSEREIYSWEGEPGRRTIARLLSRQGRGLGLNRSDGLRILEDKQRRFAGLAKSIRAGKGWMAVLARLKKAGLPLALVTGTSRPEVRRVLSKSFLGNFSVVVTGDRVKRGKPNPEPYLTACRWLKLKPAEVMVVENAPYGIESALRAKAGFIIAVASSLPPSFLHGADTIVGSVPKLKRWLAAMAEKRGFAWETTGGRLAYWLSVYWLRRGLRGPKIRWISLGAVLSMC